MIKIKTLLIIVSIFFAGCKKESFLNENPNIANIIPSSLNDFQALLDSDQIMNGMGSAGPRGPVPHIGEVGSDDLYIRDVDFVTLPTQFQNYYKWEKDVYDGSMVIYDWIKPYEAVLYSNIVLEGLEKIQRTAVNLAQHNEIYGAALFHRAHAFYQLVQIFTPPYDDAKSSTLEGLPLRLSSDLNEKLSRSSLEETYHRVISDLKAAANLLPTQVALRTRPAKQAAYGLLARTYLNMQDYNSAMSYADSCLAIQHELLDYNLLNPALEYPFQEFIELNPEIIFLANMQGSNNFITNIRYLRVSDELYNSFDDDDLRKSVFFTETATGIQYKGSYFGNKGYNYAGISTDEIRLIRAECNARLNSVSKAIIDLNDLSRMRWKSNRSFTPIESMDNNEVLNLILDERRKQLVFRGLRWSDLRRLNLLDNKIELKRMVQGKEYTLALNDLRYTYPIPNEVIVFNIDWKQNIR